MVILITTAILFHIRNYENSSDYAWYVIVTTMFGIALLAMSTIAISDIVSEKSNSKTVKTPDQYLNQTYYIDTNNHLYIDQNGTTKSFGGDISSKIEYTESAKNPSIQFKSISKTTDYDLWIPYLKHHKTKTSIEKVILPKSALTEKLTKVDVVNTQSDTAHLNLIN